LLFARLVPGNPSLLERKLRHTKGKQLKGNKKMAKLTAKKRKALPKKEFGLPSKVGKGGKNEAGKGAYPMPDKSHARNAKARASQMVKAGKLSPSAKAKIDAKANKILGKKKGDKK